jgi:N-acetylglutamate synthase-like GNAT family acetyltransferase
MTDQLSFRRAKATDAPAIHGLIADNLEAGHLLPRTIADVEQHASRFIVAETDGQVVGCAELAPLSPTVAEVRSLVVDERFRGRRIGGELVAQIATAATGHGFDALCAFTHEPGHFVRLGFSLVPHIWVPEKISHDCTTCALFRKCGQYAVTLALRAGASVRPAPPSAIIHGRSVALRRSNIERLDFYTRTRPDVPAEADEERVPA